MTSTFHMIIWPVAQNIKGFRSGCPIIPKAIGLAQKSRIFGFSGFGLSLTQPYVVSSRGFEFAHLLSFGAHAQSVTSTMTLSNASYLM